MTANQINYQKLQEEKRHNAAMEEQGQQSLRIQGQDADTRRFQTDINKYGQFLEASKLAETKRANKAKEGIGVWENILGGAKIISNFVPNPKDAANLLVHLIS